MRIGRRQLRRLTRTTVVVSVSLMLWATTSGLLLAIHMHTAERSANHDSHACTVCQQLLVISKKVALTPSVEPAHDIPFLGTGVPEVIEDIEDRCPEISRPRGPPCPCQCQSV